MLREKIKEENKTLFEQEDSGPLDKRDRYNKR
jgi:hypothetical protein